MLTIPELKCQRNINLAEFLMLCLSLLVEIRVLPPVVAIILVAATLQQLVANGNISFLQS
jgi:hypothetical protein